MNGGVLNIIKPYSEDKVSDKSINDNHYPELDSNEVITVGMDFDGDMILDRTVIKIL